MGRQGRCVVAERVVGGAASREKSQKIVDRDRVMQVSGRGKQRAIAQGVADRDGVARVSCKAGAGSVEACGWCRAVGRQARWERVGLCAHTIDLYWLYPPPP